MPTEQQMLDYQTQMDGIASEVQTQVNLTAAKQTAILGKMEDVENLSGGIMNTVLNERFTINEKLKWTNDKERKIRFNEIALNDPDYQNAKNQLWTLEEQKKIAEGEAEYQRRLHKSLSLVVLFLANNTTTTNNAPNDTPPNDTPPDAESTGAIVFESAAGFSINASSVARIAGNPYFGTASTAQALVADGKISFKENNIVAGLRVLFSEQANQFELSFLSATSIQLRRNGDWVADATISDANAILSFQRTGTSVKFYENETLRGTFPQASNGQARLSLTAPNEPASIGAGIKEAFIENV